MNTYVFQVISKTEQTVSEECQHIKFQHKQIHHNNSTHISPKLGEKINHCYKSLLLPCLSLISVIVVCNHRFHLLTSLLIGWFSPLCDL
jgi:hypothetical protein